MSRITIIIAAATAATVLSASRSEAGVHDRPEDGRVTFGPGKTTLDLTGADKKSLGAVTHFPGDSGAEVFPDTIIFKGGKSQAATIPAIVYKTSDTDKKTPIKVIDVDQTTVPDDGTKLVAAPISVLSIESMFFDAVTGKFALQNIFGTEADILGIGVSAAIPDLYIDSPGVTLYSLVNFDVYLEAIPSFSLGDKITVVDGLVASLPGMMFSTTPITFDPSSGFSGTPYSGDAVVNSMHGTTALPEPATWALMLLGAGLAGLSLRRRRAAPATAVPARAFEP